jgi:uncharacterized protein (DUF2235 family)
MRRLIVCADGTWNKPDEDDHGQPAPTNVVKIQRAIKAIDDTGVSQITFYHSGVGTGDAVDKFGGGAFGDGLDRNILECYEFLVSNYVPGDELYFFGFSRGAYTVRSLAGLIRNSGLLKQEYAGMSREAMHLYRDRDPAKHPNADAARVFRKQFAYDPDPNLPKPDFQIECIGVWDTVGALGVPLGIFNAFNHGKFSFHDVGLSRSIRIALHALAIDERRGPFKPSLWTQPKEDAVIAEDADDERRRRQGWLEQAWFAGVHSNVGGGYAEAGLSDIAFDWMVKRVAAKTSTWSNGSAKGGLQFNPDVLSQIAKPDPFSRLYDSMTPLYKALGDGKRDIDEGRKTNDALGVHTWEYVHESARLRQTTPQKLREPYAAANLDAYLSRMDPGPTIAEARLS